MSFSDKDSKSNRDTQRRILLTALARSSDLSGFQSPSRPINQAPSLGLPSNVDTLNPMNITPPTSSVWNELKVSLQELKDNSGKLPDLAVAALARHQEDYVYFAKEITKLGKSLAMYSQAPSQLRVTKCVSCIINDITFQVKDIKNILGPTKGDFLVPSPDQDALVMKCYRNIGDLFRKLQANIDIGAWSVANKHTVDAWLEALKPAKGATYDSRLSGIIRNKCTEGTREYVLSEVYKWLNGPGTPTVCWINGIVGSGKTTIAYTLCEQLENHGRLAASFFCTSVNRCAAKLIIPTIAHQLARYSAPFQSALFKVIQKDHSLASNDMEIQFERLLRDPLLEAMDAMPNKLLVVVDALDKCEDRVGVLNLLYILLRYQHNLPVKFFVASRPVPEILDHMMKHVSLWKSLQLESIERSLVRADIKLYLKEKLESISPTTLQVERLSQHANTSFLYAATLVRYIILGEQFNGPRQRMLAVLESLKGSTKQHPKIDALCTSILGAVLDEAHLEQADVRDIALMLRTVLLTKEPISVDMIARLSGVDNVERVNFGLHYLEPLRFYQSYETEFVTIRPSTHRFLFNNKHSGSCFCDIEESSQALAKTCFSIMKTELQFNICELESSLVSDGNIHDMRSRIKQKILPALAYTCRNWASHLTVAGRSSELLAMLEDFISCRLLFWVEVLNVRQELKAGIDALLATKQWLGDGFFPSQLIALLGDAYTFVRDFAASPISRCTPHLYISPLLLCPASSRIWKLYSEHSAGAQELPADVKHGTEVELENAKWDLDSGVLSIAYSPDGTRVVVGCENGAISICDARDGSLLIGPLIRHTSWVRCVAFSPDGARVLSASSDCTIQMWDAVTGVAISSSEWFMGHTYPVKSVAFSPDGSRIVSGSWDNSVCVWNALDGRLAMKPLEDHKWGVNCVAFSPSGTSIASGANDHMVRLWVDYFKNPNATVFKGHSNSVTSIAFTLNDTRLLSGSIDCTICVWNTKDGTLVTQLFQGCNHFVYSISISPDSRYVASGSADSIVRIWNINDGCLAADPLVGHSGGIRSVAFSPDSTRLLSGSHDKAVMVWNIQGGTRPQFPAPSFCTPVDGNILGRKTSEPPTSFAWFIDHPHAASCPRFIDHNLALGGWSIAPPFRLIDILKGWVLHSDGWISNDSSELLFWAPPNSTYLHHPLQNRLLIYTKFGQLVVLSTRREGLMRRQYGYAYPR